MVNKVYDVSTSKELYSALANSTGGETIRMAAGDYGALNLKAAYHNLNYDTPVTITSADPDNHAIISEMTLNGASNISFEDITFKSYYSSAAVWYSPFSVLNSSNISFDDSVFQGTPTSGVSEAEDGTGRGRALYVENSDNITVTDSEFAMWYRGMVFANVDDLVVSGNDVHSIRSDGLNFGAVTSTLVENNYIHDFLTVKESGDHADMLQVLNVGLSVTKDLIIRGNTFDIGEGNHTQTLFMRNQIVDQTDAGSDYFFQNVTIEENVILNGHAHGITVGETNGLILRNNTVLSVEPGGVEFSSSPYITVAADSRNVVLEQNVTQAVSGYTGQADWSVKNNVLLQNTDPQKAGFYESEIISSTLGDGKVDATTIRPDGEIAALGAGAERLLYGQTDSVIEPVFNLRSVEDTPLNIVFDASLTLGASAQSVPDGTQFLWNFGDGSTATGLVAQHEYSSAGIYAAQLRVVLPDGTTYTETTQVEVSGSAVLNLTAAGTFETHGYGIHEEVSKAKVVTTTNDAGETVLSVGNGLGVSVIPKEALARFFGSDTFSISMYLKASKPGVSYGEITRLDGSFMLNAEATGELLVILFLDTGAVGLRTIGANINDGQNHDVEILFDGETNSLKFMVDGAESAARTINGNMLGMQHWDLTFGNAFGKQTFDGQISNFEVNVEAYDYLLFGSDQAAPTSVTNGPVAPVVQAAVVQAEPAADPEPAAEPEPTPAPAEIVETEVVAQQFAGANDAVAPAVPTAYQENNETIAKEDISGFFGTNNFEFSMTVQASGDDNSHGEIARIHSNFLLNSKADGSLEFILWLDTGAVTLTTGPTSLHDGQAHDISITYDSDAANLSLFVDGDLAGTREASGSVQDAQYWDLTFGNPWGKKQDFDGSVSGFGINVVVNDDTGWIEQEVLQPVGFLFTNPDVQTATAGQTKSSGTEFGDFANAFLVDDVLLKSVVDTNASDENAALEVLYDADYLEVSTTDVGYVF